MGAGPYSQYVLAGARSGWAKRALAARSSHRTKGPPCLTVRCSAPCNHIEGMSAGAYQSGDSLSKAGVPRLLCLTIQVEVQTLCLDEILGCCSDCVL